MRNISEKFGREDQNPGGWYPPPLGVRRWIFTLGICGLMNILSVIIIIIIIIIIIKQLITRHNVNSSAK